MEDRKNKLLPVLIVFIILTLILGGYIIYDKIFNKEDACVTTPSNLEKEETKPQTVAGLELIEIGETGKIVTVGDKTIKIRNDSDGFLYVNDNKVIKTIFNEEGSIGAEKAYVTNDFILFSNTAQCGEFLSYACDLEGNEIDIDTDFDQIISSSIEYKNNVLSTIGTSCGDEDGESGNAIIKYENNKVTIKKTN